MEWKVGEIKQVNSEWYQCIKSDNCRCGDCDFGELGDCDIIACASGEREDNKEVYFKKLEKIGETYEKRVSDGTFSTFQKYKVYNSVILPKEPYIYCNFIDSTIEIEIKQIKENMEEKKLNLKPFNFQKAREGKPVYTRDGRRARIVCFDRIDARPILALVRSTNGKAEDIFDYFVNGKRLANALESDLDLMMLPEKKEGWVNVMEGTAGKVYVGNNIYRTEDEAKEGASRFTSKLIANVPIEWEE